MQARLLFLAGLTFIWSAGCHSYYPYGYTGTGPYSGPPPGYFAPPQGAVSSPQPGGPPRTYSQTPPAGYPQPQPRGPNPIYAPPTRGFPTGRPQGSASPVVSTPPRRPGVTAQPSSVTTQPVESAEQPVPNPMEPRQIPERVGGSLLDEDADQIKGSNREAEPAPRREGGLPSDAEDAVETIGYDDDFRPPRSPIRRMSGVAEAPRRGRKSPYKRAPDYSWVSGTVTQDPQSGAWQVMYDPDGNDEFGGVFTLAHDDALENFLEGDMIKVHGRIDQKTTDRLGRPLFHPTPNRISRLVEREESFR